MRVLLNPPVIHRQADEACTHVLHILTIGLLVVGVCLMSVRKTRLRWGRGLGYVGLGVRYVGSARLPVVRVIGRASQSRIVDSKPL
eukprot:scaffold23179_cov142-Isochrysis_galbana.AAC.1